MHVEGPLDRIGTLSAFIWLVKTIDDAATTSSWTHACHVAGRRMHVAAGRRAGDGGQGTPSYSPAHPRHQQAATAGGVLAWRAQQASLARRPRPSTTHGRAAPTRRRPADRSQPQRACVLARHARYALGHRHERSLVQYTYDEPSPGPPPAGRTGGFAFRGRPAGRVQRRRPQATAAITAIVPGRPAASSKGACRAGGHVCRPAGQADRIRTPIVFRYAVVDRSGRLKFLDPLRE